MIIKGWETPSILAFPFNFFPERLSNVTALLWRWSLLRFGLLKYCIHRAKTVLYRINPLCSFAELRHCYEDGAIDYDHHMFSHAHCSCCEFCLQGEQRLKSSTICYISADLQCSSLSLYLFQPYLQQTWALWYYQHRWVGLVWYNPLSHCEYLPFPEALHSMSTSLSVFSEPPTAKDHISSLFSLNIAMYRAIHRHLFCWKFAIRPWETY